MRRIDNAKSFFLLLNTSGAQLILKWNLWSMQVFRWNPLLWGAPLSQVNVWGSHWEGEWLSKLYTLTHALPSPAYRFHSRSVWTLPSNSVSLSDRAWTQVCCCVPSPWISAEYPSLASYGFLGRLSTIRRDKSLQGNSSLDLHSVSAECQHGLLLWTHSCNSMTKAPMSFCRGRMSTSLML